MVGRIIQKHKLKEFFKQNPILKNLNAHVQAIFPSKMICFYCVLCYLRRFSEIRSSSGSTPSVRPCLQMTTYVANNWYF